VDHPSDVTLLLHRWTEGDPSALEEMMPLVYDELRRLAAWHVARERQGTTLQPTALVHEAYLRMVRTKSVNFDSRVRFFAAAAQMMRRVLCDRARQRKAQKRGSGAPHDSVDVEAAAAPLFVDCNKDEAVDLDRLDRALEDLEHVDSRKVRIVELRYFAGLSIADSAAVLDLSPATIKREWTVARAWLANRLRPGTHEMAGA